MPTSPGRPYPPGGCGTGSRGSIAERRANMTPRRGVLCVVPVDAIRAAPSLFLRRTHSWHVLPSAALVCVVREQREQSRSPCSGRSAIARTKTFASVPVPRRNATTDYPRDRCIRQNVLESSIDPGEKWTHCHIDSPRADSCFRRHGHLSNPSPKTYCNVRQRRCARRGRR